MIPKLETERLMLRPFLLADAPEVCLLANNYEVYKTTLNVPHPYSVEMAVEWISEHENDLALRNLYHWAVVSKETGSLLGCISLGFNTKRLLAEVGYWFGTPFWNKGYGTEASRRVIAFGFETLGLNRIYGRFFSNNPASGRIMEKCGMRLEGCLREDQIKDGQFMDVYYYSVLSREYFSDGENSGHKGIEILK